MWRTHLPRVALRSHVRFRCDHDWQTSPWIGQISLECNPQFWHRLEKYMSKTSEYLANFHFALVSSNLRQLSNAQSKMCSYKTSKIHTFLIFLPGLVWANPVSQRSNKLTIIMNFMIEYVCQNVFERFIQCEKLRLSSVSFAEGYLFDMCRITLLNCV